MNPVRPATHRLLRHLLAHPRDSFGQRELHRQTGVSLGQVNAVVRWLLSRGYLQSRKEVGHRGAALRLVNPGGLLALFPLYRRMDELRVATHQVRLGVEQAMDWLGERGAVFCLDTALDRYSGFFRSPGLFCYHETPTVLASEMQEAGGGALRVEFYRDDLEVAGDMQAGFTSRIRTVIDLACADRLYAARDLMGELWGLTLG